MAATGFSTVSRPGTNKQIQNENDARTSDVHNCCGQPFKNEGLYQN